MSRALKAVVLAAVLSLSVAGAAMATKVTGGTTTITASSAAANVLSDNHITVKALSPATESGTTFTFPIKRGQVNTKTLRGVIVTGGGISLSHGTTTVSLHNPTIVSSKRGVSVDALVRGRLARVCLRSGRQLRLRCAQIARFSVVRVANVTNVSVSDGKATGTLKLTAYSAGVINRLAGKKVAAAGDVLGTGTVAPTLK